ncbi:DUF2147 domain-containing protein [Ornithobacterium rhinotracheale]|uniref:DUF2147 domain-containing protein n=1 Tax=Ornithobacterium rhinotracheale TaxID=28251 RepID=A0A3R5XTY8_ORNRH|nr:DUF2147 domain-containing protein [Ornithobacterium rhinotracheale]QAR31082.1 DUF2147 domain-containing protein [Ornithobacterium rhinotracheale]
MKRILLLLFISISGFIFAQSPVGTWKTIDDNTGKARSFVKIYEKNGALFGKIVKITNPALQNKKCEKCKGNKKNAPLLGFEVITGLRKNGNIWEDGKITDPDSGKEYSCKIELEGNNKLKVRGFLGFSLLGRTQIWERVN